MPSKANQSLSSNQPDRTDLVLADWKAQQIKRLRAKPTIGYAAGEPVAAEPVAFAALAAVAYEQMDAAISACDCLRQAQNPDGSVAVNLDAIGPYWTTSLSCIAWRQLEIRQRIQAGEKYRTAYKRGLDFLLSLEGERISRTEATGHNTQLVGWPWVEGTHSWLEPTAMALLAMRHCGASEHPRAQEAAELLIDRQIESGGANYGNTIVLGQTLVPHVMPSAMSVVALHHIESLSDPLGPTIRYLQNELNRPMAAVSLAWTIHALVSVGLSQQQRFDMEFDWPLRSAINRLHRIEDNPHRQNLLLLSASLADSPLLNMSKMKLSTKASSNRKSQETS
ncbi:hypothetical protein Q31b_26690 [Novipirellula aureliae]|uniref:Prenyltransferase and squalene oxidase repeat protein n=2 Tax=Novipirellula aureliae TaxID=2527966 RepID=A0A5C6DWV9_9BACT|nr:hypothetical protein Q31b_26690 [Novipirellula aureliae]